MAHALGSFSGVSKCAEIWKILGQFRTFRATTPNDQGNKTFVFWMGDMYLIFITNTKIFT